MGKKINQEDIKKTQKALMIWGGAIITVVLVIAIGIAIASQSVRSDNFGNPPVIPQKNKAANTQNQQANNSAVNQQQANTNQTANNQATKGQTVNNGATPTQVQSQEISEELMKQLKDNAQATTQAEVTYAEIQTSKGTIKVSLENKKMPITVTNFTKLVNQDFYNGLTFHRVEDWVIQGGDPNGNGTGGSGQTIPLETSPSLKNVRGALAMARSNDPNSATSQFYILKSDASWLDGQYAVFGNVVSGMDVVDKMQSGDKIISIKIVK